MSVLTQLGMMNLKLGRNEIAKRVLQSAGRIEEEYKEAIPMYELSAGLSAVIMKEGGRNSAAHAADMVEGLAVEILRDPPTDESHIIPMELYLICLQVKRHAYDDRLGRLIERTRQELMFRSGKISDPMLRASFLQIPEHQAIINYNESVKSED